MSWSQSPWDTKVFGVPVLQITELNLLGSNPANDFSSFVTIRDSLNARIVSCRLPCTQILESIFLEKQSFRHIEMLYQPELSNIQNNLSLDNSGLNVSIAKASELAPILEIAQHAFENERFHIDPRINSTLADKRYCNWVKSSTTDENQQLYAIKDGTRLIAFFITEMMPNKVCYWHLNAIAPSLQGKGLGKRVWSAMLIHAKEQGANTVKTCIAARNHRVLNLYARLGFYFPPPLMTLHWVRDCPE